MSPRHALSAAAALGGLALLAPHAAPAATYATAAAALSPNRLATRGAVSMNVDFAEPGAAVPAPLRRMTLRLPAGFTLDVPHLRSCSAAVLRAHGAGACPAASQLGRGRALVAANLGSRPLTESISLRLFLGALHNLQPTVEIYGQGITPFDKRVVFAGSVQSDSAPFGERLVVSVPPVATLPQEPDASIVELTLTVGAAAPRRAAAQNTVLVPSRCPAGGFPFAGEFAYADGSTSSTETTIPCPR
jgi:hypothetical protein